MLIGSDFNNVLMSTCPSKDPVVDRLQPGHISFPTELFQPAWGLRCESVPEGRIPDHDVKLLGDVVDIKRINIQCRIAAHLR